MSCDDASDSIDDASNSIQGPRVAERNHPEERLGHEI
jgi:hypothetical protein